GKKLDEITINRIQVHIKFGVPITQCNSGKIKCKSIAMTCKKNKNKSSNFNNSKSKKKLPKRSQDIITILSDSETEMTSNKRSKIVLESNNSHELKIKEQKMKLQE
ncbi:5703_t:CDS:2, partial [Cetraspora pellucida]